MQIQGCEIVVVGGGPAGTTLAALLAEQGRDVVLLEAATHPRFHVGESLLPGVLPVLEHLKIDTNGPAFLRKAGAEFWRESEDGIEAQRCVFSFESGLSLGPGNPGHAYEVDRAMFDQLLWTRARELGAKVFEGAKVGSSEADSEGVWVSGSHQGEPFRLRARYLVDASGQSALRGRELKQRRYLQGFSLAAAYRHYEALEPRAVDELYETGNIRILMREGGWAWVIPLPGDRVSVGYVSRERGIDLGAVDELVASSPSLQKLTRGSRAGETQLARSYGFVNDEPAGSRWCCIGDAANFLDPVFSSGVTVAMLGAWQLAGLLGPALVRGSEADPGLTEPMQKRMRHAYRVFASLIRAYYQKGFAEKYFFYANPDIELRAGLISALAGDLWRTDNRFQDLLMSSRRYRYDPLEGPE